MATWSDVDRLALALPETTADSSRGLRHWNVRGKGFVWERPLRKSDLKALGEAAPDGPILGAHVEHLVAKEALLADDSAVYFTTPHFDGYAAVLVRLEDIALDELEELVSEAWLTRAPKRLAKAYLERRVPIRLNRRASVPPEQGVCMPYGYLGTMKTQPGSRDDVVSILLSDVDKLRAAGCDAYIVSVSDADEDTIHVMEVWESKEHHRASLGLPEVKAAIAKAMPLLTGEFTSQELTVVGGLGVAS